MERKLLVQIAPFAGLALVAGVSFFVWQGQNRSVDPGKPAAPPAKVRQPVAVAPAPAPAPAPAIAPEPVPAPAPPVPAPSVPAPSVPVPAAPAAPPAPAPAPPVAQIPPVARKNPYVAGAADVHVISIYEGQMPGGAQRGFQQHPEGTADVVVRATAKPVMLFLSSYEPVEWRVRVEGGNLERVIAVGYHDQRVTVSGASGVEILTRKSSEVFGAMGLNLPNGFPREGTGNRALEAAEILTALTGKMPASFQGDYGSRKLFTVDASSPGLVLPKAASVATLGAGKVVLKSPWKEAVGELSLKYAGFGAYSEAWATRSYTSGKVYFEATMSVEGGGAAQPHANIGVAELDPGGGIGSSFEAQTAAILHGEQRLFKHGDAFGIAVDYDAGVLYTRVNGQWLNGEPGSGQGRRFRAGRERAAYLFATGGGRGGGEKTGMVSWQANFGATPFRYPLPRGYLSYDGSQR